MSNVGKCEGNYEGLIGVKQSGNMSNKLHDLIFINPWPSLYK